MHSISFLFGTTLLFPFLSFSFPAQDKMLRVMLYDHIVNDIKSINEKGRNPKVCTAVGWVCRARLSAPASRGRLFQACRRNASLISLPHRRTALPYRCLEHTIVGLGESYPAFVARKSVQQQQ